MNTNNVLYLEFSAEYVFEYVYCTIFVAKWNEVRHTPFYGYALMINRIIKLFYVSRHVMVRAVRLVFQNLRTPQGLALSECSYEKKRVKLEAKHFDDLCNGGNPDIQDTAKACHESF